MPSTHPHSTPTKPARPGGDDEPLSPAKFSPNPPSTSRYLPQSPISFGARMSSDDAKEIAERRRTRQSLTPTKPLARFDSLCEDSKTILTNMAGMFSPGSAEPETPESPFRIQMEKVPPSPVKGKRSGEDRRDNQEKQGQPRRKKVINRRQIQGRARPSADPIPE